MLKSPAGLISRDGVLRMQGIRFPIQHTNLKRPETDDEPEYAGHICSPDDWHSVSIC